MLCQAICIEKSLIGITAKCYSELDIQMVELQEMFLNRGRIIRKILKSFYLSAFYDFSTLNSLLI